MLNKEFKIGSHIVVHGYKGIVEEITNCKEYKMDYKGRVMGNGLAILSDANAEETIAKGYTLIPTGRTATYFTVSFENEPSLKKTSYNGGSYGCLDEFENYGTW